jgi:TatA/E family protein of Tat protein translocase
MNIGPTELVIILVIALIVFGPRKLPDLGKSLGQAMAQFRRASDDFKRSWEQEVEIERTRLSEPKDESWKETATETTTETAVHDDFSVDPDRQEPEHAAEPASPTAPTPEPAPATVAHSTEAKRSEHWI